MSCMTVQEIEKTAVQMRKIQAEMSQAYQCYIGSSLSVTDIMAVLYFSTMNVDASRPKDPARDFLVLSKGHASPALYAALHLRGYVGEGANCCGTARVDSPVYYPSQHESARRRTGHRLAGPRAELRRGRGLGPTAAGLFEPNLRDPRRRRIERGIQLGGDPLGAMPSNWTISWPSSTATDGRPIGGPKSWSRWTIWRPSGGRSGGEPRRSMGMTWPNSSRRSRNRRAAGTRTAGRDRQHDRAARASRSSKIGGTDGSINSATRNSPWRVTRSTELHPLGRPRTAVEGFKGTE